MITPIPSLGCYQFRYEDGWTVFDTDGQVYVADGQGQKLKYNKFEDALFSVQFLHTKMHRRLVQDVKQIMEARQPHADTFILEYLENYLLPWNEQKNNLVP